jgi:fluoride ion exporter CrcB/FEX
VRGWLPLGIAGMLGVLARHTVQQLVPRHGGVPWGTLIVNVSGAVVIGFVAAFVVHRLGTPLVVQGFDLGRIEAGGGGRQPPHAGIVAVRATRLPSPP